jgi:tyrosinase
MNTRRNQAVLSVAERQAFVNAVLALKNRIPSRIGLGNRYDDYVRVHSDSMMTNPGWAHRGPAFGPWHRAFIRNFELDLQAMDASVTLPYWDWTGSSSDPNDAHAPWAMDFLGGNGRADRNSMVVDGPFAYEAGQWTLTVLEDGENKPYLSRDFGRQAATLPTENNVVGALGEIPYDASPWARGAAPGFRDRLEGWHGAGSIHNRVHLWVGGSMLPSTSPNDPVFFLHHCNIDRLWADWQNRHSELPYVPTATDAGAPSGHRLEDAMQPWGGGVTVGSTLDHQAMGYQYDSEVSTAAVVPLTVLSVDTRWNYRPDVANRPMRMGPMFDLSPEDKAAGGHNLGP